MKLRLKGFQLYIGYEAAAAMTAVLLLDREDRAVCCILAAILHEMGHLLMTSLLGVRVRGLRIRLFDVLIEADEPGSFFADVMITLGGVGMNLLCFFAALPFSLKLAAPNLALGIFNLLPAAQLDGGHLLYICMTGRFSPRVCDITLKITTFIILFPLMTAGIYLLFNSGYNYSLLAISLYLTAVLLLKG